MKRTEKILSKNGVEIVVKQISIPKQDQKSYTGTEKWVATVAGGWYDEVSNGIGKFYSYGDGDLEGFDSFLELLKKRIVTKWTRAYDGGNSIETYGVTTENCEEVKADWGSVLKLGGELKYSEEWGVGHFKKVGKIYEGHHFRYGTERVAKYKTTDEVAEYLRSFCNIGYEMQDTWSI